MVSNRDALPETTRGEEEVDDEHKEIRQFLQLANQNVVAASSLSSTTLPMPFPLLEHVTKLDLPHCNLSSLPDCFPGAFPNLSILFLSHNRFQEMPAVIGQCHKLQMVAFKDNGMQSIHPDALQPQLRWLILTNNLLQELPDTIGRCTLLQKLMLSGNRLVTLPESMGSCTNLELIRLASNQLQEPPLHVLKNLDNLRWIGLSDNPFLPAPLMPSEEQAVMALPVLQDIEDETNGDVLGQGAGGVTRKIQLSSSTSTSTTSTEDDDDDDRPRYVAVKAFHRGATMTSDGLPSHERAMACAASSLHCDSLVHVLGQTRQGSLVMEYLDQFEAVAGPPTWETCTRDVYSATSPSLSWEQGQKLVSGLLDALVKLHGAGICHGDLYGHNLLVSQADPSNARLTDFGAAFFYDKNHESSYGALLERIEVRAFGVLVQEICDNLLSHHKTDLFQDLARVCQCPEQQPDTTSSSSSSSFEQISIWWKQQQLADLARSIDAELDEYSG